jgi:hypothetical protein
MAVELEGHGLVQITNSQRIRRDATFQMRITSRRVRSLQHVEICRTLTVQRAEFVLKALPFSNLLRSESLEATGASQSLQTLQKDRAELNKAARFGRRFDDGKIPASFKNHTELVFAIFSIKAARRKVKRTLALDLLNSILREINDRSSSS